MTSELFHRGDGVTDVRQEFTILVHDNTTVDSLNFQLKEQNTTLYKFQTTDLMLNLPIFI